MEIRDYNKEDSKTILSFINDENLFYMWSAGVLGSYPLKSEAFNKRISEMIDNNNFHPYVMLDNDKVVGFFSIRYKDIKVNLVTLGFIVIDPTYRGKGIGKKMLNLAINLSFNKYKADSLNLRVFVDNKSAYNCYKAVGFKETSIEETYNLNNRQYLVKELELKKE